MLPKAEKNADIYWYYLTLLDINNWHNSLSAIELWYQMILIDMKEFLAGWVRLPFPAKNKNVNFLPHKELAKHYRKQGLNKVQENQIRHEGYV